MSNNDAPAEFYVTELDHRLLSPSRQSMLAVIRDLESECKWLEYLYEETDKRGLVDDIRKRIKLIKTCGLNNKLISSQKVVFFRETVHHIEEDFLLFIPPLALCAEAFKIKEQLKLSNLPDGLKDRWGGKLDDIIKKLDSINTEIGTHNMVRPVKQPDEQTDELYNRYEQPLRNIREVLRATLSLINHNIDNSSLELYMMKINNVFQICLLPINLIMLMIAYEIFIFLHIYDKSAQNFLIYLSLGAFGGSLSAVISKGKQSLIKGSFAINFFLNVLARPVIGAASAIALILIARSQILFTITTTKEQISANGLSIVVSNPAIALQVLALVAGYGGEKLLRSTMDRIIKKLSEESSKITETTKSSESIT